jgi:hypothetical protein
MKKRIVPPMAVAAVLRAVALKGNSGVKRHSDRELSLVKVVKQSKQFLLALSSIPASALSVARASSSWEPNAPAAAAPAPDDDPRVELISLLGLTSSAGSQESLSSDSSSSRSTDAPQSTTNVAVSTAMVLPKTAELQTQHQVFTFAG